MTRLAQIHSCGNLYGPGGIGWRALDVEQFADAGQIITESRDLPGFVEGGTTYESFHFWVHFCSYERTPDEGFPSCLIVVNHGAGWRVWRGDYLTARALRAVSGTRALFFLCMAMTAIHDEAQDAGRHLEAQRYRQAFVDGRLKKRKQPGQSAYKVWIEDPQPAMGALL